MIGVFAVKFDYLYKAIEIMFSEDTLCISLIAWCKVEYIGDEYSHVTSTFIHPKQWWIKTHASEKRAKFRRDVANLSRTSVVTRSQIQASLIKLNQMKSRLTHIVARGSNSAHRVRWLRKFSQFYGACNHSNCLAKGNRIYLHKSRTLRALLHTADQYSSASETIEAIDFSWSGKQCVNYSSSVKLNRRK